MENEQVIIDKAIEEEIRLEAHTIYSVLDKGYVAFLGSMPPSRGGYDLDRAVVDAARTSYLRGEDEPRNEMRDKDKRLLKYLMRHNHTSPFEMVEFKFMVKAPLLVLNQWFRHRTWSYNSQSGRYTNYEDDEFYMPEYWRYQDFKTNKQGSDGFADQDKNDYMNMMLASTYKREHERYMDMLDMGIAREQARLFLPAFGAYHRVIMKVDAHNMMQFIKLRLAPDAQWEIRQYARCLWNVLCSSMIYTAMAFMDNNRGLNLVYEQSYDEPIPEETA